ncbi:hypothetical protein Tdes44962_MAKER05195 [Teratosphaeria destructans]|uniref:Uncharacterized protein n=1 Tax=Teratosphaeria destructans TaxID=418781 RepID=A0A9W7SKI8_9PEZI|nr:hypothetical protein Tdes44962_MAKER05195 [Teratosphaeria destructans]
MPAIHHRTDATTTTTPSCAPPPGHITLPRAPFIAAITLSALLTTLSLLHLTLSTYRAHARRREAQQATTWGRTSTYNRRLSLMRQAIDQSYARQYSGCLVPAIENPEMGSESPVELMLEERVWEAPAVPAAAAAAPGSFKSGEGGRKPRRSLFFDSAVGLWLIRSR